MNRIISAAKVSIVHRVHKCREMLEMAADALQMSVSNVAIDEFPEVAENIKVHSLPFDHLQHVLRLRRQQEVVDGVQLSVDFAVAQRLQVFSAEQNTFVERDGLKMVMVIIGISRGREEAQNINEQPAFRVTLSIVITGIIAH